MNLIGVCFELRAPIKKKTRQDLLAQSLVIKHGIVPITALTV